MSVRISVLQTKKDILDAKFEQENARAELDVVRLELLERLRLKVKKDLVRAIRRSDRTTRPELPERDKRLSSPRRASRWQAGQVVQAI